MIKWSKTKLTFFFDWEKNYDMNGKWLGYADFENSQFYDEAIIDLVEFYGIALFEHSKFFDNAFFNNEKFYEIIYIVIKNLMSKAHQ